MEEGGRIEVWGEGRGVGRVGERQERGVDRGAYPSKGSTHCKVMIDDWCKVLGQLHVKLHIVRSVCSGLLQGCYGVLCRCRLATPSNRHKYNECTPRGNMQL